MRTDRLSRVLAAATIVGLAGVLAGALIDFHAAGAAWLFAAFIAMGLCAGALSLLLAGQLTGGAWIEALAPVLRPMACAMPLVGAALLILLIFVPSLYPWAADAPKDHLVGLFFLNWPLLLARLVIALAGWSFAAFFVADGRERRGQVAAASMLVFHVVMTTLLSYDWIMALQPGFTSSVFGAFTCILFLYSALCAAALFAPPADGKARADTAGLLIACALGSVYIGFMQFLIIWYGNLPDTVKFYTDRAGPFADAILVAALVIGGLVPIALLMSSAGRSSAARLRLAASCGLAGIALHWGWCALALVGGAAVLVAPFALAAVFGAVTLMALLGAARKRETFGEPANG